jgi:hypothetical protein
MKTLRKSFIPLWFALASISPGCNDQSNLKVDIIKIEGVSWACNVSTSFAAFGSGAETENDYEVFLPASDGDLLYMIKDDDLQFYYRYQSRSGTTLTVTFDTVQSVSVYLNNKLDLMELTGPPSLVNFRKLTEPEVKQLSTLHFDGPITEEIISTLKHHEAALTGKGLVLEDGSASEDISELLSICRPRMLIINDSWTLPETIDGNSLADLELLWMEGKSNTLSKVSPYCPKLESLILDSWKSSSEGLLQLSGIGKLRNITIAESDLTSLSEIEFPSSIHSLQMVNCETLSDISKLDEMDGLNRLCLTGCGMVYEPLHLNHLESLQWLSFPPNITYTQFGQLAESLIHLKVVELIGCDEIKDLAPLQSMKKLTVLELQLDKKQLLMLDSLDQVELIVLSDKVIDPNPVWFKVLRESMPNTKIVPGSGMCLGSGWLLLLLPCILLFRSFFRRKS